MRLLQSGKSVRPVCHSGSGNLRPCIHRLWDSHAHSGAVKLIDALLNLGIPYASYIGISGIENPAIVFVLSIVMGVALYLIGRGCWKLLVYYIKGVSKAKQHLSI